MTTATPPGLLFGATDVDPAHEVAFNRWYDQRHVPQREALPGFVAARRFEVVDGAPKYLALYDLVSVAACQTPEYKAVSAPPILTAEDTLMLGRFVGLQRAVMQQIAQAGAGTAPARTEVGGLLVVCLQPEPAYEEEFNEWYSAEHIVYGAAVPGVLRVRRFQAVEGAPKYVALWELSDLEVTRRPAFREALDTPWAHRIRQHYTRLSRGLYRPR